MAIAIRNNMGFEKKRQGVAKPDQSKSTKDGFRSNVRYSHRLLRV